VYLPQDETIKEAGNRRIKELLSQILLAEGIVDMIREVGMESKVISYWKGAQDHASPDCGMSLILF
jgi:hypothetical protein